MTKKTNNKSNTPKKEFQPSVGFWPAKSGNGFTVGINEQVLEVLQKAELGGRLLLTEVSEDIREENERAPTYRIIIFGNDGSKSRSAENSDSL